MGGIPAFLEVGTRGRSWARWDPASVRNCPKNTPTPPPVPTRGMRKGADCGQCSKKECFHPKWGLTQGVCLAGVALNRRILREKRQKKRGAGCWQQGIFAQISESTKTAGNCPKTEAAWTPDTKRQREPGSKTSQKTCRKGRK